MTSLKIKNCMYFYEIQDSTKKFETKLALFKQHLGVFGWKQPFERVDEQVHSAILNLFLQNLQYM